MRLALKLVLVFMLANIALAGIYGYLAVRREVFLFRKRAAAEAEEIGPVIEKVLDDAWNNKGDRGMRESLHSIFAGQEPPPHIRWVWFDTRDEPEYRPACSSDWLAAIVIKEHVPIETDEPDGISLRVYWPVALAAERKGGLEVTLPMSELEVNEREIIQRTVLLIGGMLLISVLLAVLLGVRLVGRPLEQLIAKARRIGDGDLGGPVHLSSRDELAELAENLNAMCAKLAESQNKLRQETAARIVVLEQLRHADRLKTVGRLASGIAHELGTPLNVVAGRAGLISSGKLDAEQIAQSAGAIKLEADKMTTIIRQLLDFARASAPRKLPVDLRTIIRQTIDMLDSIAEKQKVRLIFAPDAEEAVAEVDAGQIQQVLTNLTINAIQAMPDGGEVQFAIGRRSGRSADGGSDGPSAFYAVEVRDQGVGIPEEHMQQLFEPFFTTKEVGAGTGLGLSIAYGIVEEHGGWIDVTSRVGEGSCFTVYLPQGAKP
ncbi:MAG: HAMP domain-containing sensor histidine kinase [Thermoguttaceae bacterium]|jgi:signal transduction histidine kinase